MAEDSHFFKNAFVKKPNVAALIEYKDALDAIQFSFQCCGINGPHQYMLERIPLPQSCCADPLHCKANDAVWQRGCFKVFQGYCLSNFILIGYNFIGLAMLFLSSSAGMVLTTGSIQYYFKY